MLTTGLDLKYFLQKLRSPHYPGSIVPLRLGQQAPALGQQQSFTKGLSKVPIMGNDQEGQPLAIVKVLENSVDHQLMPQIESNSGFVQQWKIGLLGQSTG